MPLLVGQPALVVIDMQRDFIDPLAPLTNVGGTEIVPRVRRLVDAARSAAVPIVFTFEVHRPDRTDAGLEGDPAYHVPIHTVEGTPGAELVEGLEPKPQDCLIYKRRYNCFLGTDLELVLRGWGVKTLLLCGVSSDICVHWTAGEAYQRDYHVRVIEDCVAGTHPRTHEGSLDILRRLTTGGREIKFPEILAALDDFSTPPAEAQRMPRG